MDSVNKKKETTFLIINELLYKYSQDYYLLGTNKSESNVILSNTSIREYIDIVLKSEKKSKRDNVSEQLIWKKIVCLQDLNLSDPLIMFKDINYYQILGLKKDFSKEEIDKSYCQLLKLWSPENNSSDESISNFNLISKAYRTLSNKATQKNYDKQPVKIFTNSIRRKIWRDIERRQNNNSLSVKRMIWNSDFTEEGMFTFKFNHRKQLKSNNRKHFKYLLSQFQKLIEERLSIYYDCQINIQDKEECTISCLFNSEKKLKFPEANEIYCYLLRILSIDNFDVQRTILYIWMISMIILKKDCDLKKKRKVAIQSKYYNVHYDDNAYDSDEEIILLRPNYQDLNTLPK